MSVKVCHTYHKDQQKISQISSEYYRSLGFEVDTYGADFKETPESECRNKFFKRNPETDFILFIDSDEVIIPEEAKQLVRLVETLQSQVFVCNIIDYVSKDSILKTPRPHKPVVAVKNRIKYDLPVRFKYNRNITFTESVSLLPITIHHLGYIINTEWKIKNYKERNEFHELGNVEMMIKQVGVKTDIPKEVGEIIGLI